MRGGNLRANPSLALRNYGIAEADYIYTLFEHTACKFLSYLCIVKHYGNYRVGALDYVKAEL